MAIITDNINYSLDFNIFQQGESVWCRLVLMFQGQPFSENKGFLCPWCASLVARGRLAGTCPAFISGAPAV